MTIIEQSITAKSPATPSEDGIAATDHYVAVVDGSTSKTARQLSPGKSNGRLCMELVCDYVGRAEPAATLAQFCDGLTAWVRNHYPADAIELARLHPEERMTASCIVYSRARREIWMIGDCQCMVDGRLYDNPKPYEQRLADRRAAEAHRLLDSGAATIASLQRTDIARQTIIADMIEAMRGQNHAYAVVDGFPIALDHVRTLTLDQTARDVVLASDGYPSLQPTLAASEAALSRQLALDPLCIGAFKATKGLAPGNRSFDDRAYVRLKI